MNLVLDDAEEVSVKKKTRKGLGRILLKARKRRWEERLEGRVEAGHAWAGGAVWRAAAWRRAY